MNIFQLSISILVFGITLLLGTTAVIALRFAIATVTSLTSPATVPEIVAVPPAEPEQAPVFENLRSETPPKADAFDPTGSYSLDTEKIPAAFADIEFFEIAAREYEQQGETFISRPIIPTGSLQTRKMFTFTKIATGNREFSFETAQKDGISYQFVGTFHVSTEYIDCEDCEYPGDLGGRLKKLKNGRVIAEMDAKFYMNGC